MNTRIRIHLLRIQFDGARLRDPSFKPCSPKWYSRTTTCELPLYEFPTEPFELVDAGAGYFISRTAVAPKSVTKLTDLVQELLQRGIELRFLPDLWPLRDAVAASSLEFSILRFRNASPRPVE